MSVKRRSATDLLNQAKLSIFMAVTGCSCFLCHCKDWEQVNITRKDFRLGRKGGFHVSKRILKRVRKELSAKYE